MSRVSAPGLGALLRDLRRMSAGVSDTRVPDSELSETLAAAARKHARVRSGRMRDSITPGGSFVDVFAVYAPIVHERHGNPFVTQAVTETQIETPYVEHVEDVLESTIRRSY